MTDSKYLELAQQMVGLAMRIKSTKDATIVEKGRAERLLRRARVLTGDDIRLARRNYSQYLQDYIDFLLEFEER